MTLKIVYDSLSSTYTRKAKASKNTQSVVHRWNTPTKKTTKNQKEGVEGGTADQKTVTKPQNITYFFV